jgi:hypothetical protein
MSASGSGTYELLQLDLGGLPQAHPVIGLVTLAVLFFQPILGYIHHINFKRLGRRTAWSYGHLAIGRVMITLGIINGGLGLWLADASTTFIAAYSAIAGVMWMAWVIFAAMASFRRDRVRGGKR